MNVNNWAVLVCSSDYWFNYRHMNSILSIYNLLLRRGYFDSHIIVMSTFDEICSPKNPSPGCIIGNNSNSSNIFLKDSFIDFKGRDANIKNLLDLLNGRNQQALHSSKQLLSDENSDILLYFSGHGGDGFFKFNDFEELITEDIVNSVREMEIKRRYRRILFIVDTCQAETLGTTFVSPNITFIGSSRRGENSYGYQWSDEMHAGLNDRFTHQLLQFFDERYRRDFHLQTLVNYLDPAFLHSNIFVSSTLTHESHRDLDLLDFFSAKLGINSIHFEYNSSSAQLPDIRPLYLATSMPFSKEYFQWSSHAIFSPTQFRSDFRTSSPQVGVFNWDIALPFCVFLIYFIVTYCSHDRQLKL